MPCFMGRSLTAAVFQMAKEFANLCLGLLLCSYDTILLHLLYTTNLKLQV
jgi:hypothetical protein